jgi:hypothetical protein
MPTEAKAVGARDAGKKTIGIVAMSQDVLAVGRVNVALCNLFGFHYVEEEI